MPEDPLQQEGDPLNRLKADSGSLSGELEKWMDNPICSVPDEKRAKAFAAMRFRFVDNMLLSIRQNLIRLVKSKVQHSDYGYLESWGDSSIEGEIDEAGFVEQMQNNVRSLIDQIELLPQGLQPVAQIHQLLNTMRATLFQFITSYAQSDYADQAILLHLINHDAFRPLIGFIEPPPTQEQNDPPTAAIVESPGESPPLTQMLLQVSDLAAFMAILADSSKSAEHPECLRRIHEAVDAIKAEAKKLEP